MTLSDVMKETQHVYRYSVIDEKVNTNIQQITKDTDWNVRVGIRLHCGKY